MKPEPVVSRDSEGHESSQWHAGHGVSGAKKLGAECGEIQGPPLSATVSAGAHARGRGGPGSWSDSDSLPGVTACLGAPGLATPLELALDPELEDPA